MTNYETEQQRKERETFEYDELQRKYYTEYDDQDDEEAE